MSYQAELFSSERLVLVTGGRPKHYQWRVADDDRLRRILLEAGATAVLHGDAEGVDRHAGRVALAMSLTVHADSADWQQHGDAAGRVRNLEMLDREPALVVAFPGGPGTANMVKLARAAGVEVRFA